MCHNGLRPWNVFKGDRYLGTVYAGKMANEDAIKQQAVFQGYFGVTRAELVEPRDR